MNKLNILFQVSTFQHNLSNTNLIFSYKTCTRIQASTFYFQDIVFNDNFSYVFRERRPKRD